MVDGIAYAQHILAEKLKGLFSDRNVKNAKDAQLAIQAMLGKDADQLELDSLRKLAKLNKKEYIYMARKAGHINEMLSSEDEYERGTGIQKYNEYLMHIDNAIQQGSSGDLP